MSFFSRIRERFAVRQQQEIMVRLIDMYQANRPLTDRANVRQLNEDGYRRNALIFACIAEIATTFREPAIFAMREAKDGELKEVEASHPLRIMLRQPNKEQTWKKFALTYATILEVAGNVYVYKMRAPSGMPVELYLLRPDAVKPVPDSTGKIIEYRYGAEPNVQTLRPEDVIHEISHVDPLDQYLGLSPISVLSRWGDLDNYSADYLRAFFLNAGIPSILLKTKTRMDATEREAVRERWSENYNSVKGWHRLGVIDADVDVEEIGSKIRTMDLANIFGETESRICSVFGIPPIIVGAYIGLLRSSYANYEQARKSFYSETMIPKWEACGDALTVGLASEFDGNIQITFDTSNLDALQEEREPLRQFALQGWDNGLLTRNEALEMSGMDRLDEEVGDVYKLQLSDIIQGANEPSAIPVMSDMVRREMLALPAGVGERHDAVAKAQWRALQAVADKASPTVKKKSWQRSRAPRRVH